METTNHLVTTPATTGSSSCHGGGRDSGGWLSHWRGLVFGAGAIVVALALALNQHWLTIADLPLLLFLLPCGPNDAPLHERHESRPADGWRSGLRQRRQAYRYRRRPRVRTVISKTRRTSDDSAVRQVFASCKELN